MSTIFIVKQIDETNSYIHEAFNEFDDAEQYIKNRLPTQYDDEEDGEYSGYDSDDNYERYIIESTKLS